LIAVTSIKETEIADIWEEAAFRTKIPAKGKWPILKYIALSTKIFCITNVLAGSSINNATA
jgi:hypothetical protein